MDKPGNFYKNTFHHLYNRGAFKQKIFLDSNDYDYFIRKITEYKNKCAIELLCYCLMPNHFHLFVEQTTQEKSISDFISRFSNSFTKGMNKKYKRTGVLFEGKTKNKQVEDDTYFKWVAKYILTNPVKAKIVNRFDEYEYSSAKEILGVKESTITDNKKLLSFFDSIDAFKIFVEDDEQNVDYGI
jgi:REP element-mobilizing transposase RayT